MNETPAWEDPRRVLSRYGLRAKRGMSQNFLTSRSAVEKIAEALRLAAGDPVVELGPGLGTLTATLLRHGAHVIALDADRDMLDVLDKEFGQLPALSARFGDATELDLAALLPDAERVRVAGNLPYAVTGAIFRRLVEQHARVLRAVLMVQKEVRDRLIADPGSKQYGALTVFTRGVFDVHTVCIVPAGAFHPPPRVDSAVVELVPCAQPIDVTDPTFVSTVRSAFEARRKTLRNALQRSFDSARIDRALEELSLDGKRRGETLSGAEFSQLAAALQRQA